MENASEAMKIAFALLMFVLALSMSISSFSQARETIDSIITMKDRETSYTYVEPTGKNRIVGAETIIPTMYKAYKENFKIYFFENDGTTPLTLYSFEDKNGKRYENLWYIDLEQGISGAQSFSIGSASEAVTLIDGLLKESSFDITSGKIDNIRGNGLYDYFTQHRFMEVLGEYYQEDANGKVDESVLEINKTKKRVITYILQ